MNWGDLLEEIRDNLEDTSAAPKYTDKQLFRYTREAVADYSQWLPLKKSDVTLTQDLVDPKKFALPTDFIAEISVECPDDHFLEPRRGRLGTNVVTSNRPFFYRLDDTNLFLNTDPGDNDVILSYDAYHPMPTDEADVAFEFTIPEVNIELIKLYVEGKVNTKIRNAQSRLDRFKIGAGARTDNPIIVEVEDYFAAYKQKLAERTPSRSLTLYKSRKYK